MTIFPKTPNKPSSAPLKPHQKPSNPLVNLSPRCRAQTASVAALGEQGLDVVEGKDREYSKPDGSDSDSDSIETRMMNNEGASRALDLSCGGSDTANSDSNAKEKWVKKEGIDQKEREEGGFSEADGSDLGPGSAESIKRTKRRSEVFDFTDFSWKRSRVVDRSGLSHSDTELENVDAMEKTELGIDGDGEDDSISGGACHSTFRKQRYSKEDKGKGILIFSDVKEKSDDEKSEEDGILKAGENLMKLTNDPDLDFAEEEARQEEARKRQEARKAMKAREKARRREYQLRLAREFASKYAHCNSKVEDAPYQPVPGTEISLAKSGLEDEDWSGPFSTALGMVRQRTKKVKAEEGSSTSVVCSAPLMEWVPSQNHGSKSLRQLVPSLEDLCLGVLSEYAEGITSLEGVPDSLRSKLSHSLCDSRKMDQHFLALIVSGSPYEIRLKDGTWMTDVEFQKIFEGCDTENLQVLQLDLCGRCMTDYILRDTLAQSPNCLPALTTVSLKAAYRFSDNGLNALVLSAPSLRSINLEHCCFLTSTGINILADNLGSVLKELFLDDCNDLDAMSILPALKKLKHLEVLSVGGIESICDKFVIELMPVCGPNMKELVFADCGKLTDASLKIISKHCSGLLAINLANLKNLTDLALQHLANGCRSLQVFKLRHNAFSDEAVAAFLEVSGGSLRELSLNNIREVANNTAISLATHCSKTLLILDLSWCRKLKDEALGLIVEKCFSLRLLRLFGCTQVTNKFLDGLSNPLVRIIGLKTMPLLEHLHLPDMISDTLQSELCN